jgi:hypothetical protein
MKDLLTPLAPAEPRADDVERLLATADRRTRRRRVRVAGATVTAAVALTAVLAALPADRGPQTPLSAAAFLRTTAAVAAEQPAPPAWTGYRYLRELTTTITDEYTLERTTETWADSAWQGRSRSPRATVTAGAIPPARPAGPLPDAARRELDRHPTRLTPSTYEALRTSARQARPAPESLLAARDFTTPHDMPNLYGDGPLATVPLDELPTDPVALAALLVDAEADGRWHLTGGWEPLPDTLRDTLLRDVLVLLTEANATPAQRAALIAVLERFEGATVLGETQDRRGRTGRGVQIPGRAGPVRILFAPGTSELLEWSEPGEIHTYLASGHVTELGARPAS